MELRSVTHHFPPDGVTRTKARYRYRLGAIFGTFLDKQCITTWRRFEAQGDGSKLTFVSGQTRLLVAPISSTTRVWGGHEEANAFVDHLLG
jgi:hypothetical protein